MSKEIDRLDRKILRALQAEGRLTNIELAERVNLSATATAERVRRLTREGYITGYMAMLSPQKLGRNLLVFIEVKLDRTTADVFDTFAAAVKRSDDVMECHMVAGGFDYLVKARVAGMEAYRQFPLGSDSAAARRARNSHLCSDGRSEGCVGFARMKITIIGKCHFDRQRSDISHINSDNPRKTASFSTALIYWS